MGAAPPNPASLASTRVGATPPWAAEAQGDQAEGGLSKKGLALAALLALVLAAAATFAFLKLRGL
jgi:hypothetical protein